MVIGTSDGQSYESEMHYNLDIPQLMESKDYNPQTDVYQSSQLEEPKKVHIVRHGETTENASNTVRGWEPVSLNDSGIEEAHRAGKELKDKGVQVIVSSDLQRAKETAEIIKKETGAELQFDPRLRTWDVGEHAGQPCEKSNPILAEYAEHKQDEPVPGGESFNDFTNRSFAGIRDAVLNNKDKEIAILTHNRVEATLKGWEKTGQDNPDIDYKEVVKEETEPGTVRSVTFQPDATILKPGPAVPVDTFAHRFKDSFDEHFPGPLEAPVNKGEVLNWLKRITPDKSMEGMVNNPNLPSYWRNPSNKDLFNPDPSTISPYQGQGFQNIPLNEDTGKGLFRPIMEEKIINKIIKEGGTKSGGSSGGSVPRNLSLRVKPKYDSPKMDTVKDEDFSEAIDKEIDKKLPTVEMFEEKVLPDGTIQRLYRNPSQQQQGKAPETITHAAVKVGDRIYTGHSHLDAFEKIEENPKGFPVEDGFMTSAGRFVDRHEAAKIGDAANQRDSRGHPSAISEEFNFKNPIEDIQTEK